MSILWRIKCCEVLTYLYYTSLIKGFSVFPTQNPRGKVKGYFEIWWWNPKLLNHSKYSGGKFPLSVQDKTWFLLLLCSHPKSVNDLLALSFKWEQTSCMAQGSITCHHTLQTGLLNCGLEHTGIGLRNVHTLGGGGDSGGGKHSSSSLRSSWVSLFRVCWASPTKADHFDSLYRGRTSGSALCAFAAVAFRHHLLEELADLKWDWVCTQQLIM